MFKDFWKDLDKLHKLVEALPKQRQTTYFYYFGEKHKYEIVTCTHTGATLSFTTNLHYVSEI